MKKQITVLPGDGVGKEVTQGAVDVLKAVGEIFDHQFNFKEGLIGGAAIDEAGNPLPDETVTLSQNSDAILLGAVGGPKWDQHPVHLRPEKGLLGLRKALGLYANLRPVQALPGLLTASSLKEDVIADVDLVIVRELTGGLYFGQPSERRGDNQDTVVDTLYYEKAEMRRIIDKAFQMAQGRSGQVTSVDKANVLESSRMWREVADEVARGYPDVTLEHMLVDNAAMQLISNPKQFDVIVTENMFGDILSDEASMLTGSLGMLPSASLGVTGPGLYEPVHGSAPDIAGENKANPLATILSTALMLRYSLGMAEEAKAVEAAVKDVLQSGYRTADLAADNDQSLSSTEMAGKVIDHLENQSATNCIMATYY